MSSTLAIDIVARGADSTAAQFAKVAAASDKAGSSMKKNSKISAEAAKASDALTKAHNAESNALDKVQVAEARLADVRSNAKAKAAQVVAAEKGLSKARREAAIAGDATLKASKSLGDVLDNEAKKAGPAALRAVKSIARWLGAGAKDFEKAGQEGGELFSSGLQGALKTPVVGPALIAGIIATVEAAAVPAGAVVASGLVAGAGAGLSAIGLKFAAESQVVKQVWSKTASDLGASMRTISKPFEASLVAMSMVARRTFATFKPELAAAFKTLGPALAGFGDQLGRALGKLAPAIQPLAGAFKAVLGALGPALNDVFGKLSTSLIKLSDSVQKSPTALADFARAAGNIVGDLLHLVTSLNDADAAFKRLTGISAVTAAMGFLRGAVQLVIGPLDLLSQGLGKVADGIKWAIDRQFPGQAKSAATSTTTFASALFTTAAAIKAATGPSAVLATTFARQSAATDRLIGGLNRMSGLLLTLSGAQVDYAQAVADATAAVKANGKTHDLLTQKGRDNQRSLLAVAQAAGAQRDAMLKAGDGNVRAAQAATTGRAAFIKLATQMGYTIPQARAMAASMIAIPSVTRTAKLQANKADLEAKLKSAKAQLADPHLTATKQAQLKARIADLEAGIAKAKAALASVPASKTTTITITTVYSTKGVNLTNPSSVGRRASGGPVSAGKPYVVGEHGPELIVPRKAGYVLTARATRQIRTELSHGFASAGAAGTASDIARESAVVAAMIKAVTGGDKKLANALAAGTKRLEVYANLRAKVAGQLAAARDRLAAAVQVRDDFKKQITDAAMSFNNIAGVQAPEGGQLTASGIIAQMTENLRRTQQFAANLAQLKKRGLNNTTYQQIAEAGVEQGGGIAAALLSGNANTFNTINRLQSNISSAAAGLGDATSKNLYQAGVNGAQGLVNGLLAKTKALDAASAKLAAQIVTRIKHDLGIHSPSKVLGWHGSMATLGFAGGMVRELPTVGKAAAQLANTALPGSRMQRRGGVPGAGVGAGAMVIQNVTINIDGAKNPMTTAVEVQQALLRLKRLNGGRPLGFD
ncbi:hypothetical protein [Kribbella sp. NPDC004536]|uniref:hypothetical protein n=1 Tax=Kribbella sp. NPDC004536 TaxID=3364106 RepID=UPI0036C475E2